MSKIINEIVRRIFLTGSSVREVLQKPIIQDFLGTKLGKNLDIGCGGGIYTSGYLASHSEEVYGIDLNDKALKYLNNHRKPNTFFIKANAEALPFKKGSFDTILCTEVIEHLENDKETISQIGHILKENGIFVCSTPHPPAPYPDKFHIREGYTLEDLTKLCEGFTILRYKYCMFKLTRAFLKFRYHFRNLLRFSPPILPLVYIEKLIKWGTPFDIVIKAQKKC